MRATPAPATRAGGGSSPGLGHGALLTDLYELAMLEVYRAQGMDATAVFEFFVRALPPSRGFLLAAGLEPLLDYLEALRFTDAERTWLTGTGRFSRDFVDSLADFRFRGDVHAMPEGTVFFAGEPVVRVTAALPEAQAIESRLVNLLHVHCLLASKAARIVLAAPGRLLVDFGFRRAHGAEAGLAAARSSYIAGFAGTATVLAGMQAGIPIFGTMAHSFVQSHAREEEAFLAFARARPGDVTLLVDTYDTERGARRAVAATDRLAAEGIAVRAVRLDSGDLAALSRAVRTILDDGGHPEIRILASGGLDEARLVDLVAAGAPIDGFGVGTSLDVSADAPSLDCVYKIQEYAGRALRKRSTGKATLPGRKQVFRRRDRDGSFAGDAIALETDAGPGEPLLEPVMSGGRRLAPSPPLEAVRARARDQLERLPAALRGLAGGAAYPVEIAASVRALAREVDRAEV